MGALGWIVGWAAPGLRHPYRAWMALGHVLGLMNSHVILGLVFIFVLHLIAFMMRLLGHDTLRRGFQQGKLSYRERRASLDVDFRRTF